MLRKLMRFAVWAGAMAVALGAAAKSKTAIEIQPGPTSMSAEEKAIVARPDEGTEHGVILVEEYERNENLGTDRRYAYHMRAKVLSAEGRAMGDLEIPHDMNRGELYEWWGRTILPDGTVLELKQEDLQGQIVAELGPYRVRRLKGALPGLVPGCVIDYGYVYRGSGGLIRESSIALQRAWPIRRFSYRWVPYANTLSSYRMSNTQGLKVATVHEKGAVLVTGTDIPAFVEEVFMPPRKEVQPTALFYYIDRSKDVDSFWSDEGRRLETQATEFFDHDKERIRETLESIRMPEGADLETKLKTAYDWILDNIKNLSLRSREELDVDAMAGKKEKKERQDVTWAKDVLDRREGGGMQISHLFVGFARALGAEAHVMEVPDRTDHYFDPKRYDTNQFNGKLIVVSAPGQPYDKATIVDPGDGLPWGELPWWVTGTSGLLGTSKGSLILDVPAAPAHKNLVDSRVEIAFADEDQVSFRWSRRTSGAGAHSERGPLLRMSAAERKKRLEKSCGSSDEVEISQAEVVGVEKPRQPLEVTCEGAWAITGPTEDIDTYRFSVDGLWNGGIPELKASKRVHPLVFNYARTDTTVIDVKTPEGFVAKGAPPAVKLDMNVGAYRLSITKTETGYHVKRSFTFTPPGAPIDPRSYEVVRQFLNDAREADRTPLVFEREGPKP